MRDWRISNICPDYEVCNYGTVRRVDTKNMIQPYVYYGNNLYVSLRINGVSKRYKLCEVVADAFIDDIAFHPNDKVIHKNENRQDNRPENLIYVPIEKSKVVSYTKTKLKCIETGEDYHNLYECSAVLDIGIRKLADCIRCGSMEIERADGEIFHFELIE